MRLGENFAVNYMSRNNDAIWLWLDVKLGKWWYVFMWHKDKRPYTCTAAPMQRRQIASTRATKGAGSLTPNVGHNPGPIV